MAGIETNPAEYARKLVPFLNESETAGIIAELSGGKGFTIGEEEQGMVMVSTEDHNGCAFYVGEVLVTKAEAVFEGKRGFGMVAGAMAGQAKILACLDAAESAGDEVILDFIIEKTAVARERYHDAMNREKLFTASTKVDFGLMAEG